MRELYIQKVRAASSFDTPAEILEELAYDDDWFIRKLVALHPFTPVYVIAQLAVDQNNEVRFAVSENFRKPPWVDVRFSEEPDECNKEWVKYIVEAHDPETSPSRLGVLAKSLDVDVRYAVALNPSTSAQTLERMSNLSATNYWMRYLVAQNPNVSLNTLKSLANDSQACVRVAVAEHPNTPAGTLLQLIDDPASSVRDAVLKNPNTPPLIRSLSAKGEQTPSTDFEKSSRHFGPPERAESGSKSEGKPSNKASVIGKTTNLASVSSIFDLKPLRVLRIKPPDLNQVQPRKIEREDSRERLDIIAVSAVLQVEEALGHQAREMLHQNPGFDVLSVADGATYNIEVKGKALGLNAVQVSRTQIENSLVSPDEVV